MYDFIGVGYLGLDDDSGYCEQVLVINVVIEVYGEVVCYIVVYQVVKGGLVQLKKEVQGLLVVFFDSQKFRDLFVDMLLDFECFSEGVLVKLCQLWFGQLDGQCIWGIEFYVEVYFVGVVLCCLCDFFKVLCYVFGLDLIDVVKVEGCVVGCCFIVVIEVWLVEFGVQLLLLVQKIVVVVWVVFDVLFDLFVCMLVGIMLGFLFMMYVNLLIVLVGWVQMCKLWEL